MYQKAITIPKEDLEIKKKHGANSEFLADLAKSLDDIRAGRVIRVR